MKDHTQISQWLIQRLWIIAFIIILGMGIWIAILNNSNYNHMIENEENIKKLELLEKSKKELQKDLTNLKKDYQVADKEYAILYQKYIKILSDDEYTTKNPINFIQPDGQWRDITSTIKPVADGKSYLTDRFLE